MAFNLYMFSRFPHDKPRSNNRASVRAEVCKVHREFRTSRRALNVLSVRAGLPEQGILHSAPSGQTNRDTGPLLDLGRTRRQVGVGLVSLGLEVLGVHILAVAEHLVVLHLGVILACLGDSRGSGIVTGDVGGERPA